MTVEMLSNPEYVKKVEEIYNKENKNEINGYKRFKSIVWRQLQNLQDTKAKRPTRTKIAYSNR